MVMRLVCNNICEHVLIELTCTQIKGRLDCNVNTKVGQTSQKTGKLFKCDYVVIQISSQNNVFIHTLVNV